MNNNLHACPACGGTSKGYRGYSACAQCDGLGVVTAHILAGWRADEAAYMAE